MNTEFAINKKEKLLLLTITTDFRHRVGNTHVRVGYPTAMKVVKEQFVCPKEFTLGECLTPTTSVDNEYENRCTGTWIFSLVSKSTSSARKKTTTSHK
jgi:hypothetical protein